MNDESCEMAYLSGAFDGDGSFSLIKKVENKSRSPLYFPYIQFGSKGKEIIDLILNRFGGRISLRKAHKANEGFLRQDFYTHKLEKSKSCRPFLEKIIPYLKIKKDRAIEILKFIDENPFVRGSKRLDEDTLFKREKAYWKIRQMNDERNVNHKFTRTKLSQLEDEYFWPYVAGLMDTDGSFSINKSKYSPTISISMVDARGIEYIRHIFKEGNIDTIKAKTCKTGLTYRWSSKSIETVVNFTTNLLPYLRVKHENAKILLEYCEKRTTVKHRRGGISKDEIKLRHHYYEQIKNLNKYGVYKPSLIDLEVQEQDDRAQASESCAG